MSPGNGTGRGRYRFARWTLTADTEPGLRHYGECLVCLAKSVEAAGPDGAQLWCLRHAGMSGHTSFQLFACQFFEATPT